MANVTNLEQRKNAQGQAKPTPSPKPAREVDAASPEPQPVEADEQLDLPEQPPKKGPWYLRLLDGKRFDFHEQTKALEETVTISEVIAPVHHVVETGHSAGAKLAPKLDQLLKRYHATSGKAAKDELRTEILKQYAVLTALTYGNGGGINGRTLKSSQYIFGDLWIVGLFGLLSFSLAAYTHILGNYYSIKDHIPGQYELLSTYGLYEHVLVFLLPAFWGALGATIALTMKIAERARANKFDSRKLRGQISRIGLGAVFAAAIVHLFNLDIPPNGFVKFGPIGLAFMTGLGVKVIYGGFETMVNRLADVVEKFDPKFANSLATESAAPNQR